MKIAACTKCGAQNRVDETRAAQRQPVCGRCGAPLDPAAGSHPVELTDATFDSYLGSAGDQKVLVDCWAPWCGPCRLIAPVIEEIASESAGRYRVAKLNVDENPQVAARLGISAIPALMIFEHGQVVQQMVGVQSKQAIMARLIGA